MMNMFRVFFGTILLFLGSCLRYRIDSADNTTTYTMGSSVNAVTLRSELRAFPAIAAEVRDIVAPTWSTLDCSDLQKAQLIDVLVVSILVKAGDRHVAICLFPATSA